MTALVAFFIGGLLVLATGHNPFQAYWDIVNGAGLNWLAHPTNTDVALIAAYNFSQTLLQTTSLILTLVSPSRSPSAAGCSTSAATAST